MRFIFVRSRSDGELIRQDAAPRWRGVFYIYVGARRDRVGSHGSGIPSGTPRGIPVVVAYLGVIQSIQMLRRILTLFAVCSIVALLTLPKWAPSGGKTWTWTTSRRPPLQGPVQGDWFTDLSEATAWAQEVEPPQRWDVGVLIYQREPVVVVSGPAQPAVVSSIRYDVSIPRSRLAAMLSVLPCITAVLWVIRQRRDWLRARRARNGCCPMCGYDLRASKQICPECGSGISSLWEDESNVIPSVPARDLAPDLKQDPSRARSG
jgi:hypothetical protein